MKDPGKFTIAYTIGGAKFPHALCDLGPSINVMMLKTFMELKIGDILSSNMMLTLVNSSITHCLVLYRMS